MEDLYFIVMVGEVVPDGTYRTLSGRLVEGLENLRKQAVFSGVMKPEEQLTVAEIKLRFKIMRQYQVIGK